MCSSTNNSVSSILNSSSPMSIMNEIDAQLEKKIEECQQISAEHLQQLTSCDSTQSLASIMYVNNNF